MRGGSGSVDKTCDEFRYLITVKPTSTLLSSSQATSTGTQETPASTAAGTSAGKPDSNSIHVTPGALAGGIIAIIGTLAIISGLILWWIIKKKRNGRRDTAVKRVSQRTFWKTELDATSVWKAKLRAQEHELEAKEVRHELTGEGPRAELNGPHELDGASCSGGGNWRRGISAESATFASI